MSKWFGKIGYCETIETSPGVWTEQITEREYYGDLLKVSKKTQSSENLNDNITISNQISIVADPFANENLRLISYVTFMGTKWKIASADVQYPRIILTMGGVYNG